MIKRASGEKRQPVKYPSVPDLDSRPTQYNEPALQAAADRVPVSRFEPAESKADVRLQVERLLLRKESAAPEAWARLGPVARTVLIEMLDDESVVSREALLHRVIAVLGQLAVKRSIAPLGAKLIGKTTANLTKAYAANALGRIGEFTAIDALAAAADTRDDMVRRQVAIALGRIDRDTVVPYLLKLRGDKSIAVAEAAAEAMLRWDERLGQRPAARSKAAAAKVRKKKLVPGVERPVR